MIIILFFFLAITPIASVCNSMEYPFDFGFTEHTHSGQESESLLIQTPEVCLDPSIYNVLEEEILETSAKYYKKSRRYFLHHWDQSCQGDVMFIKAVMIIFDNYLKILGKANNRMAQLMGEKNVLTFGKRNFSSDYQITMDLLCKEDTISWHQALGRQIDQITQGIDSHDIFERVNEKGCTTLYKKEKALDIFEYKKGHYAAYLHHKEDSSFEKNFLSPSSPCFTAHSASYYWTLSDISAGYLLSRDTFEERIYCFHQSGLNPAFSISLIGYEDFKKLLFWREGHACLDDLKTSLISLLWRMSHASLYISGQDKIVYWLLVSLARAMGYHLRWIPFDGFEDKNTSLYQQALTILDRKEFVRLCQLNNALELDKMNTLHSSP